MKKLTALLLTAMLLIASIAYANDPPAPFAPWSPPLDTLEQEQRDQYQQMRDEAKRLIEESKFTPPPIRSYWQDNPTLGIFASGSSASILWINGKKIDLRICNEVKLLKKIVRINRHRDITGVGLPGGYSLLFPENIEEIASKASCSTLERVKDYFSK